jgi:MFS family permease
MWYFYRIHLLRPRPHFQRYGSKSRDTELGNRVHVPAAGVGLSLLAAHGLGLWEATGLPHLFVSNDCTYCSYPACSSSSSSSGADYIRLQGIMVWAAHTDTNGQWIASKIVQGFFEAPIESLCEISIADIYFAHERGTYMGAYALMLFGSNFIAPIIAGFINDGQGWQWVLYWSAIISAVGFVILFFLMEETNYYGRGAVQGNIVPAESEPNQPDSSAVSSDDGNKEEKKADVDTDIEAVQASSTTTTTTFVRKTYWDKLKLIDTQPGRPTNLLTMMYRPVLLVIRFPVIFFSGFEYGTTLVMFNIMNATASLILGSPPYNFSPAMVGLSYFAPFIGVFVGSFYAGWFGDKMGLKLARANKGIREPEHKLWLFSLSLLLVPGSLILWGVGAYYKIHWVGLLFGMGILAVTNAIGSTVSLNYTVDSYKDLSGEAVISIILVRNTMSFAIGYGITPWINNTGLRSTFLAAAFIGMGCTALFLPMIKFGKEYRVKSKELYWKYVETSVLSGH